jgi:hypothetical protein
MYLFTDLMPDRNIRYLVGWSMILVTLLNISVNFLMMLENTFRRLKLLFRRLKQRLMNNLRIF